MIKSKQKNVIVIGAGCAGLSLCKNLVINKNFNLTLIDPKININCNNHIWGFWKTPWVDDVIKIADYQWVKWKFINNKETIVLESMNYPYYAIYKNNWLNHCEEQINSKINRIQSKFNKKKHYNSKKIYLDSRNPTIPKNSFLQHFYGVEVKVRKSTFNPKEAILMDFRVDQSNGIHFIYLLPFSKNHALIESTMFTKSVKEKRWYLSSIKKYLDQNYNVNKFKIIREEFGMIPMEQLRSSSHGYPGIGANGNAIRISSGYAFSYIQKQVKQLSALLKDNYERENYNLIIPNPHKKFDIFLDKIFVDVLKHHPDKAPELFLKLVSTLNGDQMARFMSGASSFIIYIKIIYSMPKYIFLYSFFRIFFQLFKSEYNVRT